LTSRWEISTLHRMRCEMMLNNKEPNYGLTPFSSTDGGWRVLFAFLAQWPAAAEFFG
jgi:hypothetical protein